MNPTLIAIELSHRNFLQTCFVSVDKLKQSTVANLISSLLLFFIIYCPFSMILIWFCISQYCTVLMLNYVFTNPGLFTDWFLFTNLPGQKDGARIWSTFLHEYCLLPPLSLRALITGFSSLYTWLLSHPNLSMAKSLTPTKLGTAQENISSVVSTAGLR